MGMGKIYLPQHSNHHHGNHGNGIRDPISNGPSSPSGLTYPLPPRLGVCLDFEKGRVTFFDAHSLRPLWEGHVDCSGPVCPAFCFIGGGALQLQELVANRNADQTPVRRVTIQTRVSNINNNNWWPFWGRMVIWNVPGNCEVFTQLEQKVRLLSDFDLYFIFFLWGKCFYSNKYAM